MNILVKLTTRSRPDKMFRAIDNIISMATASVRIIVSLDIDDSACNTVEVQQRLSLYPNLQVKFGYSKNKIAAFNRDIPKDGWDIIIATSDDIIFKQGYDLQIESDATEAAIKLNAVTAPSFLSKLMPPPEWYDFTIWYGDGALHGKIMTVPIMTKKYYDRLGYIYNPQYQSLFCDEEAIHVGEKLGKIFYSSAEILEHMHPAWGKGVWDAQYKFTDSFYHIDKKVFDARRAMNFPL